MLLYIPQVVEGLKWHIHVDMNDFLTAFQSNLCQYPMIFVDLTAHEFMVVSKVDY